MARKAEDATDLHLWKALRAAEEAGEEEKAKRVRWELYQHHRGYIVDFMRRRPLNGAAAEEYEPTLVAAFFEAAASYDWTAHPSGYSPFGPHLRRYLLKARNTVLGGSQSGFHLSSHAALNRAHVSRQVRQFEERGEPIDWQVVADETGLTVSLCRELWDLPEIEHIDRTPSRRGERAPGQADHLHPPVPSFEEELLDDLEREEAQRQARLLEAQLHQTTDLQPIDLELLDFIKGQSQYEAVAHIADAYRMPRQTVGMRLERLKKRMFRLSCEPPLPFQEAA